jgi:hydroxymethylglutaryl-CoA lyase
MNAQPAPPRLLTICEVGARDGLQNEKGIVTTEDKMRLLDGMVAAGLRTIELTAFVSPKAVPMMADADALMRYARTTYPDLRVTGLVFNEKGYERAREHGANAIALVLIVPDALSRSNTGKTADDWLDVHAAIIRRAQADGVWVRAYLAGAWVCPFEGAVDPARVLHYGDALWALGIDELCPTDPIGHAHPEQVGALLGKMAARYDVNRLAVHLHDTQALGLANAYAALAAGVRTIDASVGGLGGCPFAPGAAGNLATEDLVFMAEKMGYTTGVDTERLFALVDAIEPVIGRPIGGRIRAWWKGERARREESTPG